jgi:glycosyltransferase involved in cell wall biosynthesis
MCSVVGQPGRRIQATVVLPARNASETLDGQLEALAGQTFDAAWEVIVVDDASTDDTAAAANRWSDRLPNLEVLSLSEHRGCGGAKNLGARRARGELVCFCDADDVVAPSWLDGLVTSLAEHDLVTGPWETSTLNPRHPRAGRNRSPRARLPRRWHGYLIPVVGANMGVRRVTFESVGGFEEQIRNGEDFDFAFRVQLAGGHVGFSPQALVHYRLRRGWPYLRRHFEYGLAHVELYCRFRDLGLRRNAPKGLLRFAAALFASPLVLVPRYRYQWMGLAGVELGRMVGSMRARTLFL